MTSICHGVAFSALGAGDVLHPLDFPMVVIAMWANPFPGSGDEINRAIFISFWVAISGANFFEMLVDFFFR